MSLRFLMFWSAALLIAVPMPSAVAGPFSSSLTINLVVSPPTDPGRFNLQVNGVNRAYTAANGSTTGPMNFLPGTYTIGEVATPNTGTNLSQYIRTIGGACGATGVIHIGIGQHPVCTITNAGPPHGTWVKGPGPYTFFVCPPGPFANCAIVGAHGLSIPIKIETWGGGGGGGDGELAGSHNGAGGAGGGGGGYGWTMSNVVVPMTNTVVAISVVVGAGGVGGTQNTPHGGNGGITTVSLTSTPLVTATGGNGGSPGSDRATAGGAGGNGSMHNLPGSPGAPGGTTHGCNGQAGGGGGTGGGPGQVNGGGAGGHGGYYNGGLFSCNSHGQNWEWSAGNAGAGGKVAITW